MGGGCSHTGVVPFDVNKKPLPQMCWIMNEFGQLERCSSLSQARKEAACDSVKEQARTDFWRGLIDIDQGLLESHAKTLSVFFGLPAPLRCSIWQNVSGADVLQLRGKDVYLQLVHSHVPEAVSVQIEKDRHRTFTSSHRHSNKLLDERSVANVLKAFSAARPSIGYVQGMNFVAAALSSQTLSEEQTFWLLMAFMDHYDMERFYSPGFHELRAALEAFEQCVDELFPSLRLRMGNHSLEPAVYATPWFLTAFAYRLPLRHLVRVWDAFFLLPVVKGVPGWRLGIGTDDDIRSHMPAHRIPADLPGQPQMTLDDDAKSSDAFASPQNASQRVKFSGGEMVFRVGLAYIAAMQSELLEAGMEESIDRLCNISFRSDDHLSAVLEAASAIDLCSLEAWRVYASKYVRGYGRDSRFGQE